MSNKSDNWAPARIWLQREQGDHGSHTWCEDSVGDGDIIEEAEYVRVDASQPKRCPHCDGTGDVHRADGEWLGECTACDANDTASQPKALTNEKIDAAILEWFSYERDQDDFRARMRAAIIAATEAK